MAASALSDSQKQIIEGKSKSGSPQTLTPKTSKESIKSSQLQIGKSLYNYKHEGVYRGVYDYYLGWSDKEWSYSYDQKQWEPLPADEYEVIAKDIKMINFTGGEKFIILPKM